MKQLVLLIIVSSFWTVVAAQKVAYIPSYLLSDVNPNGKQFTWSKTAQSSNFTLIWGNDVGIDPTKAVNPDLVFNPKNILDTMEVLYSAFKKLGFVQDQPGTKLSRYKIPIIMLNTFGTDGDRGWAYGGSIDGEIGAFWVHPLAMQDGHVAAHELAHSLQAQTILDYRTTNGLGGVWNNDGIFWETHASFMTNLIYPQDVTTKLMDTYAMESWGQWKNTYENYHLLFAIQEEDGISIINKMWRESYTEEYPIAAYKRLMKLGQQQLNDKIFRYARRMVALDFPTKSIGTYLRASRNRTLANHLPVIQSIYTILHKDAINPMHFRVPIENAPEEYGYNIIPLIPTKNNCRIFVKFKGHTEVNPYSGWRYGFVTTLSNGDVSRYSNMYASSDTTVSFSLSPNEARIYLVVMGAPNTITTDPEHNTWKGYAKRYRFPYELTIQGADPEGHQKPAEFRKQLKTNGHIHPNGGGWIQNTATVENSVFVAPYAIVLGNSELTDNVRIENTAIIDNASISNNVIVRNNAVVKFGFLKENATIAGQAFAYDTFVYDSALIDMRAKVSNYTLHGNIHVGGDVVVYNKTGDCDNGTYFKMINYYQNNLLECDNRTAAHPENTDVNSLITPFTSAQMDMAVHSCNLLSIKAFLQGAMLTTPNKVGYNTLMRDNLRTKKLIPTTDPYRGRTGYTHVANPTTQTITNTNVLTTTGNNAIVDWVFVELRDKTNTSKVVATQSALIQRDGDVVSTDWLSLLAFDVPAGDYNVALRHRNHLSVMAKNPTPLSSTSVASVDFTNPATQTQETNAQVVLSATTNALWAGDTNGDGTVVSAGTNTDVNTVSEQILRNKSNSKFSVSFILQGYSNADTDLDGTASVTSTQSDLFLITNNILRHPANKAFSSSFVINKTK